MYDLGLLEGVVGVTLLEFVVLDTEDSGGEGILGANGIYQRKNPGLLKCFQQVIFEITCYGLYFIHSTGVTSFE